MSRSFLEGWGVVLWSVVLLGMRVCGWILGVV